MLWNGGSGYKVYIFKESTRYYTIDRKSQGRKEVIYLRVAHISCTQGVTCLTSQWRTPVSGEPQKPPKIGNTTS